jgi:hypothetical protein
MRRERALADARLIVFGVGAVVAWLALRQGTLAPAWLAVPTFVFLVLIFVHERARRATRRADRAVEFYEKGLARLEGRWSGTGEPGTRFLDPEHPYAADLDLFGAGSLFELLCTARTKAGEDALAAWLLNPAPLDEIGARQEAIAELRPRIDLREDLAILGADVRAGIDPEGLAAWGASPRVLSGRAIPIVGAVLSAFAVAGLLGWAFFETGPSPFFLAVIVAGSFALWLKKRVRKVLAAVERRASDLRLLAELLARLEREPCEAPRLRGLREALTSGETASHRIARLARLVHLVDTMKNQFFAPIGALLLWSTQLAFAIEAWRASSGRAIADWLAAAGDFEALCALAAYSYENPGDPFPELEADGPLFVAEGVGHPLIEPGRCVRNDLSLGGPLRVLVVSGSNMSGKSTLLRTVGINTVLALAGAPVRADRLRISPMAIGATLRIQDSLQAGRSRFFAEITRLRQLVDLAKGPLPLLFLLDEILNGTNSHDRRVGAESLLRGLIGLGAIGLVTTHDLALAEIVDRIEAGAENVHFADHFEGGTMHFDHRMRPGVVRHSNALALMRAVGLDV